MVVQFRPLQVAPRFPQLDWPRNRHALLHGRSGICLIGKTWSNLRNSQRRISAFCTRTSFALLSLTISSIGNDGELAWRNAVSIRLFIYGRIRLAHFRACADTPGPLKSPNIEKKRRRRSGPPTPSHSTTTPTRSKFGALSSSVNVSPIMDQSATRLLI